MKLFGIEIRNNNIKKEEAKTVYSLEDKELADFLGVDLDSDKAKEATFYTSLKILTDNVSKLPLKLHRENETDSKHYLYNLLKLRPNQFMNSSTFWKTVEYQRSYYGHSVVLIDYSKKGKINSLIPLDMSKVEILIDDISLISNKKSMFFKYTDKNNKDYIYKNSEVLHFMGMTKNGFEPMAVKDYLATLIDNSKAANDYTNSYLKNGLHSKGIIKYVGDISEEGQSKLQERMNRLSGGVNKAGQIMPLPVGMDFQNITSSMADSQFTELQELTIKQIAAAFGVKLHQLNEAEGTASGNVEHQQKAFYIDTLQTILTVYEQELTYKLLTQKEIEDNYFFRFNIDSILRSQSKERAEYLKLLVEGAIITSNEARKTLDFKEKEGADELIINGSYLPLALAAKGVNYQSNTTDKGGDNENEE